MHEQLEILASRGKEWQRGVWTLQLLAVWIFQENLIVQ